MRLLTACTLLAVAALTAGAADAPKDAAKKLDGTYEVVDFLVGGKPDAKKDEVKSVEIKDGEIVIKGERNEAAKFTLDPTQKPPHIDITPTGGAKVLGVYEVKESDKGTELTIAFAKDKSDRPKDLKGEGKGEMVLKLLRKKAK